MTDPSSSDADARFTAIAKTLSDRPDVTYDGEASVPRRFGSTALKVDGKIFAMLVGGALVVKLPKSRVEALSASGDGQPFDTGSGRVMREWVSIPDGGPADWDALAAEALTFVDRRG